jgi:ADP-ribose pyrophosphatase YjhB (NUDIX family)
MALQLRHRFIQRAILAYGRLSRGMTLGVRAMLLADGRVVLVKHSYVPGWYLPGGGVEAGESFAEALAREIFEEAGATLTGPAQLFAVYRNARVDRRDHVGLFVCRHWEQTVAPRLQPRSREIVACESFPVDALPQDVTPATRLRVDEVLSAAPAAVDW